MRISDWSSDVCSSDLEVDALLSFAEQSGDSGRLIGERQVTDYGYADAAISGQFGRCLLKRPGLAPDDVDTRRVCDERRSDPAADPAASAGHHRDLAGDGAQVFDLQPHLGPLTLGSETGR